MPLMKFGALAIRTLSKPVANAIKKRAIEKEVFRQRCADFAQWWHRMEVRLSVNLTGHTVKKVLGEGVVFSIAALILFAENRYTNNKEIVKKAALEERFESQMRRTQELETAIALLREDTLRLMERTQGNPALISKRRAEERSRLSSLEAERSRPVAEGAWGALLRYTGFAGDTGHAEAAAPPAPPMPSGPPTPSAPSAPPAPPNGAPAVPQQSAAQPDKQQGTPTGSGNTGDRTV